MQGIESGLSYLNILHLCASDSHVDLVAFLASAQVTMTGFLPIAWYSSYFMVRGGFALLNQSPVKAELSYAFKRLGKNSQAPDEERQGFSSSVTELTILKHSPISRHPNIKFEGICCELIAGEARNLPVLVFEKQHTETYFIFGIRRKAGNSPLSRKSPLRTDSRCTLHTSCFPYVANCSHEGEDIGP